MTHIDLLMLPKLWSPVLKWSAAFRAQSERQRSRTLLLHLFVFYSAVGGRTCGGHCTQNTGQCPTERGCKKLCGEEVALSWDSVSQTSVLTETCGQTDWQDAESSDSGLPAGPGVDLDPPGDPCTPWTSLPHAGELWCVPGEWLSSVLHVIFPLLYLIFCHSFSIKRFLPFYRGRGALLFLCVLFSTLLFTLYLIFYG